MSHMSSSSPSLSHSSAASPFVSISVSPSPPVLSPSSVSNATSNLNQAQSTSTSTSTATATARDKCNRRARSKSTTSIMIPVPIPLHPPVHGRSRRTHLNQVPVNSHSSHSSASSAKDGILNGNGSMIRGGNGGISGSGGISGKGDARNMISLDALVDEWVDMALPMPSFSQPSQYQNEMGDDHQYVDDQTRLDRLIREHAQEDDQDLPNDELDLEDTTGDTNGNEEARMTARALNAKSAKRSRLRKTLRIHILERVLVRLDCINRALSRQLGSR